MKKVFSCLIVLLIFASCKHDSGNLSVNVRINIHYIDSLGDNLYSDGTNGYVIDSALLYSYADGIKTLVDLSNPPDYISTVPNGVLAYVAGPLTGLSLVQTNIGIANDSSIFILHLKQGVDDTISCEFANAQNVIAVWYNGAQVLSPISIHDNGPDFIIQK